MPEPATPAVTPSPHRFHAIDSLRGLCACLVALYHFRNNASPLLQSQFIAMSWQFVDLFFVISGFVMALNYRQRLADGMPATTFMTLRLGRIYPLHVVVLAAFVAMEGLIFAAGRAGLHLRNAFDANFAPDQLIKQLFFLDGIANLQTGSWNYPTWSIATEFWTYLLFALAVVGVRRHFVAVVALTGAAAAVFLLALSPRGIQAVADWGLVRCVYGFSAGVLCQAAWTRWGSRWLAWRAGWSAAEIVVLAVVLAFVPLAGPTRWNLLAPPLFAATVLIFARQGGWVSRLLLARGPLYLGAISYSIYMVHVFVEQRIGNALMLVARAGGPVLTQAGAGGPLDRMVGATPLQGTVLSIAMLVLVIAVASLTYRYVELPGQRWSRRLAARRTAPA